MLVYTAPPDGAPDSLWTNLQASYRRFETDEVPGARVRLRAPGGVELEAVTDAEGYAHFDFVPPAGDDEGGGFEVTLSLPDSPDAPVATATIVRPRADARFGVVSDVDDTVLVTEATSVLRMMRLTLLESPGSRVAFPGVGAFYRALAGSANPLFYVSSSPWNLYEFLVDFMRLKGLPEGPLLLRDLGIDEDKLGAGTHGDHKLDAIRSVLERHAELDFVLIGDSGQHDPEIYETIVTEHRAGCARSTSATSATTSATQASGASPNGWRPAAPRCCWCPTRSPPARHAASLGLIDPGALAGIGADVAGDLAPHEAADGQDA